MTMSWMRSSGCSRKTAPSLAPPALAQVTVNKEPLRVKLPSHPCAHLGQARRKFAGMVAQTSIDAE